MTPSPRLVLGPSRLGGFAGTVVGTAVGAGLVLLGASRVWSRELVEQPPPLRPEEILHTGASLAPALPALGVVALAAAGGLLATRGWGRRVVGAVLCLAAVGTVALVLVSLSRGGIGAGWPVLCLLGAVLVGAAGGLTLRRGQSWPVMGARYARPRPSPAQAPVTAPELWDAVDRGDDPTA